MLYRNSCYKVKSCFTSAPLSSKFCYSYIYNATSASPTVSSSPEAMIASYS